MSLLSLPSHLQVFAELPEMEHWDREGGSWRSLNTLAGMRCWLLQLSDTLLPNRQLAVAASGSLALVADVPLEVCSCIRSAFVLFTSL